MQLLREVRSQAHVAWVTRSLWTLPTLARTVELPVAWYVRRDGTAPAPIVACHYISWACPEACTFCNVTGAVDTWTEPMPEAELARMVERLAPRIPVWAVGGGEPLAHGGIVEHYARLKAHGARVYTATAATVLGEGKARRIAEIGVDVVHVSLLGDEAAHDAAMGRPGAWRRTTAGLSHLLRHRDPRRTRVLVNCPVDFGNAHALGAVAATCRELGVDALRFTWLSFLTRAELATETHRVTTHVVEDDVLAAFDPAPVLAEARALERAHRGWLSFHPHLDGDERAAWFRPGGGVSRRCHALWHTLFLRPDGSVVPCQHLFEEPVGNVRTDDLEGLWNGPALRRTRLSQRAAAFPICRRCCKV
ncbi:MAG: hypothetical protein RLZZ299_1869 [Pseudomonadota bacterium]|jgi:MoaA/NifB/PqqE/SkfB family radical SAM enzyme